MTSGSFDPGRRSTSWAGSTPDGPDGAGRPLHACVDEGEGDLLLHIGALEIWDSAGLGVLVGAHRRARRAGRRVVLTEVPPRHLRLLRATRLHRLFVVEPRVA